MLSSRSIFSASTISIELAAVAVFGAEEEVLGDLLGDGAATRHPLVVGRGQQPDRAGDALEVQALVLVEPRVLDGDEGLLELQRDLVDLDRVAAGLAELGDQLGVGGVDAQGHLQARRCEVSCDVGQAGGDQPVQ